MLNGVYPNTLEPRDCRYRISIDKYTAQETQHQMMGTLPFWGDPARGTNKVKNRTKLRVEKHSYLRAHHPQEKPHIPTTTLLFQYHTEEWAHTRERGALMFENTFSASKPPSGRLASSPHGYVRTGRA